MSSLRKQPDCNHEHHICQYDEGQKTHQLPVALDSKQMVGSPSIKRDGAIRLSGVNIV
jgi:hypothetical protein